MQYSLSCSQATIYMGGYLILPAAIILFRDSMYVLCFHVYLLILLQHCFHSFCILSSSNLCFRYSINSAGSNYCFRFSINVALSDLYFLASHSLCWLFPPVSLVSFMSVTPVSDSILIILGYNLICFSSYSVFWYPILY